MTWAGGKSDVLAFKRAKSAFRGKNPKIIC
jgi:hypothetical protein